MRQRSADVDSYLKAVAPEHRNVLDTLRSLIHELHPDIDEAMEYNMPTFKLNGAMVAGLASRARYISLYCKPEVVDEHRDDLGKLNVGKGCIRFRKLDELPMATIRAIILKSKP